VTVGDAFTYLGEALAAVFSFVVLFAIFLSLFAANKRKPPGSQNQDSCSRSFLKFLGSSVFPQYKGDIKTDQLAQCLAAVCVEYLTSVLFNVIVTGIYSQGDPNGIGCTLRWKANILFASLLYTCFQWFLYVKASISHVHLDPDMKPLYLKIMLVSTVVVGAAYTISTPIVCKGMLVNGVCSIDVPLYLGILVLCMDIPLQILNFIAFYIPLRQHMKEIELLAMKETRNLNVTLSKEDLLKKNNFKTLYMATRKAMQMCLLTICFIQMTVIPFLFPQFSSSLIAPIVARAGIFGCVVCLWYSVKWNWGCNQCGSGCLKDKFKGGFVSFGKDPINSNELNKTLSGVEDSRIDHPSQASILREDPRKAPLLQSGP
jgi:hypothetical protein